MTMTIGNILKDGRQRLRAISTSASLDTQLLLAEVLDCDRAHLIAHPEEALSTEQAEQVEVWLDRREQGEPVAYILGRRAFYDRELRVTPAVLIPRPETEHLLETALEYANSNPEAAVVDVGTGSGALAITLKANAPEVTVYAVDVSRDALEVAFDNARQHRTQVHFAQGDLLEPLIEHGIRVDLVMANLPYIASDDLKHLEVARHEPALALDGGADGLGFIRRLLEQIPMACNPGARILLEIGADQGAAVVQLAWDMLSPHDVNLFQDYAGLDRLVRIDLQDE